MKRWIAEHCSGQLWPCPGRACRPTTPAIPSSPLWGPQALRYVEKNTPAGNEDGALSVLCQYTLSWLCRLAMPLFRDTPATMDPEDPAQVGPCAGCSRLFFSRFSVFVGAAADDMADLGAGYPFQPFLGWLWQQRATVGILGAYV